MEDALITTLKKRLTTARKADKEWFLALLDGAAQQAYEEAHLAAVLAMLKVYYIAPYRRRIAAAKEEAAAIRAREGYGAEDLRAVLEKNAYIAEQTARLQCVQMLFFGAVFCAHGRGGRSRGL